MFAFLFDVVYSPNNYFNNNTEKSLTRNKYIEGKYGRMVIIICQDIRQQKTTIHKK